MASCLNVFGLELRLTANMANLVDAEAEMVGNLLIDVDDLVFLSGQFLAHATNLKNGDVQEKKSEVYGCMGVSDCPHVGDAASNREITWSKLLASAESSCGFRVCGPSPCLRASSRGERPALSLTLTFAPRSISSATMAEFS
jgi:hypothetical protein